MELAVEVRDVAGAPVANAEVTLELQDGGRRGAATDRDGRAALGEVHGPGGSEFRLTAAHPMYIEEEVYALPPKSAGQYLWDNPVWTFAPPAFAAVRLSRIRAAPIAPMSDDEMKRRGSYNPQAVFTWKDAAGNDTRRYLGLYNGPNDFVPISHPLLPEKPGDGWGRFNHGAPAKLDPSRAGQFCWLEWGTGAGSPKLLAGVWVPRWRSRPSRLDFTIFFTPNTHRADYPDAKDYPYMAWKAGDRLVQPYVGLGQRYLFHEKWLSYQLLAAKRQSIVVVPIQPKGQWGPFAQAAGLSRLLAEITHFLHRTSLTSGGDPASEPDLAPSPNFRFGRLAIQQPLPALGRVVLSGFSAGVRPIAGMLPGGVGQRLNDRDYGVGGIDSHVLFGADSAPFLRAWQEVWDHDAEAGGRAELDKHLPGWLRADGGRMARCYQTDYTGSQGWIDRTPLREFAPGPIRRPANGLAAAEVHAEGRCSLVYFGAGYLKHAAASAAPSLPAFWAADDMHQAVPMVTFMHAALLSGLPRY